MKELYSDDLDFLVGVTKEIYSDEVVFKTRWGRMARRCIQFANGDQNMDVSPASSLWVNNQPVESKGNAKYNAYCTNEIEPIIRTMVSFLTRSKPSINCVAENFNSIESKAIGKVAEDVINAKYDLDGEMLLSQEAATWMLTVGTCFGKDSWDSEAGQVVDVDDVDEMGQPIQRQEKVGNNKSQILSGFTVGTDYSCTRFEEIPYIFETYIADIEWVQQAFDKNLPGYTGLGRLVTDNGYFGEILDIVEELKFSIPYLGSGGKRGRKGKCLVTEWYIKPNKDFPQGRMMVKAGDVVVYATEQGGENPYFGQYEPVMWHPYTMGIYEQYIGRLFGKSLVEQLIPIQMRINEINAAILENAQTLARPNLIAPEGCLKKGILTTNGVKVFTYQPVPGAPEPHAFEGIPLPSQFFNEKQGLIDQVVRIAGTNFVMQGQSPTGVTAASAIAQLLENANTQHSPLGQRFQQFHEERFTKKLRVLKKFQMYPDNKLNFMIQNLAKENFQTEREIFIGQKDIGDNVNVKIEAGTMLPKSEMARQKGYADAIAQGLVPALGEDSARGQKVRDEIFEKLGLESIKTDESVDAKKAAWENEMILLGKPVEVSLLDIAEIHMSCHRETLQNPEFLENASDEQKMALYQHYQAHEQAEAQKQQQAQEQQMQMQQQQLEQQMQQEVSGKEHELRSKKEMAMINAVGKGVEKGNLPMSSLQ